MSAPDALPQATEYCPTTTMKRLGENNILIVDVRSVEDYSLLRLDVPEQIHIPLEQLEERFTEVPAGRDVIVVSVDGSQSLKATYFLMYQGYTSVANMKMGIRQWLKRDFPVTGDIAAWQQKHPADHSEGCC
ncbi:rhodanese-like domain-containing protein [Thalassolituus oleivorans]|uniref:Rhodanese homology domain superfamily protein n=1 Tax=Thalassolituus oleivorans MIL-1 TaxID=1298593 RepID=M5DRV5_9GAMM|nr:rhodanese-like domain-containing protein [Thalassolituus oleivorans]PHQ85756.1 MAG: rhodanese-like domain-containing protein [Thalassobium sp.]CCU72161.1 rhodanese homology domain superfamily protein [Thalassolituus oleivorans MIL-1]